MDSRFGSLSPHGNDRALALALWPPPSRKQPEMNQGCPSLWLKLSFGWHWPWGLCRLSSDALVRGAFLLFCDAFPTTWTHPQSRATIVVGHPKGLGWIWTCDLWPPYWKHSLGGEFDRLSQPLGLFSQGKPCGEPKGCFPTVMDGIPIKLVGIE